LDYRIVPENFSAIKMAFTSAENKQFAAEYDAGPIFMFGGASTAHEILSECRPN
jgi:hypothetical protein